jgi:FtsP/CotA-like multicopper oxidase with cupredoxin domain
MTHNIKRNHKWCQGGRALSRLAALLSFAAVCNGEYIFPELEWSAEACQQQGFTPDQFELCATLEFCEGSGSFDDGYGRDRKLRQGHIDSQPALLRHGGNDSPHVSDRQRRLHNRYSGSYSLDEEDEDVADVMPSEGSFGWRIAGTEGCGSPGPIVRLSRGGKYGLFVSNTAEESRNGATTTNLHLHGLHISGSGNADDVTREVKPGDVAVYNLTIPEYHMGGTFWYHSHHHGHTRHQVGGGAFGMLVIDDGEDIGTEDPNVREFLNNERILIADNLRGSRQNVANGIETLRGGGDVYHLNRDEWYRFRILHVNVDSHQSGSYIRFGSQCEVYPIAHDGIFRFKVPRTESQNKIFLSSSSRMDVAVKCSENSTIESNSNPLAKIEIDGGAEDSKENATPFVNATEQWHSTRPPYLQDFSMRAVDTTFDVELQETSINKQQYNLEKPLCHGNGMDFAYGSLNEWTLKGTSGHPFHVHIYPMQVVGDCGEDHEVGEFYDTIAMKTSDYSDRDRRCAVRLHLIDVAGHAVMHCHILQHEDQGSMGFINIVGSDEEDGARVPVQPSEPRFLHCANGDESCDEVKTLGKCTPKMPMVHAMPNHNTPMDDMEMEMDVEKEEMMEKDGYYGER